MINRVVLVGRLTRNPELRKTQSNSSVASFTLAVDNRQRSVDGQRTTSFINCVAWNALADNIVKFTKKGSLVGVDGRLNQRSYKNNSGVNVQVVEVICENVEFLSSRGSETPVQGATAPNTSEDQDTSSDDSGDVTQDDLPF
jgi:single-strand DNA-binding protein